MCVCIINHLIFVFCRWLHVIMIEFDEEISERLGLPLDNSPEIYIDTNNNGNKTNNGDKYSLRPRSVKRRSNLSDDFEETIITTKSRNSKNPKAKPKPPPLSKYRRKTANARERSRMKEINQAFETLRRVVPQLAPTQQQNEKITKITTLRLAMKYIAALSAALTNNESPQDLLSDCSDLDWSLLESDGESLPLQSDFSDQSLTPPDFSVEFPDHSLTPIDFSPLSSHFTDSFCDFDPFLGDFS